MDDIAEKRVYGDRSGDAELVVAAGLGVLSVAVSAANVGGFGVAHRCEPADVAADGGLVAVAAATDVLVRRTDADDFVSSGFGPAAAVGVEDGRVVAAAPDGRVGRLDDAEAEPGWTHLGDLDAAVRAIDGDVLAAADGVHRLPGLEYVGLDDAHDVAAAGPLAATGDGLYSLGNGWMDERAGEHRVVGTDGERAHAAAPDALVERRERGWRAVDLPVDGRVVDVAHGTVTYAVTADGDLLAEGEDGWLATPLGVGGVVGCALA